MESLGYLSSICDYPRAELLSTVSTFGESLKEEDPLSYEYLTKFSNECSKKGTHELEEMFTNTFDIRGVANLDIGYVLFGEDYKRGEFLVNIKRLQKENNVDTGVELPDHLTNFLKLLSVIEESQKKELIEKILMPALEKILDHFDGAEKNPNFYVLPLLVLDRVLERDYTKDRTIFGGVPC